MSNSYNNRQSRQEVEEVSRYLAMIGNEERLTDEETLALVRRIRQGDDSALNRLTRANLKFVVSIAAQYRGLGLDLFDLINEGNMGLIQAARKFDPEKGVQFISYAVWWIRQSIGDALSAAQKERDLAAASLNDTRGNDRSTLADYLEDEDAEAADSRVVSPMHQDRIQRAMQDLLPREREVIKRSFGFNGSPMTMAEIGEEMGLSRNRVRQIRKSAFKKLKKHNL